MTIHKRSLGIVGATALAFVCLPASADEASPRAPATDTVYGDSADIPAHDPSVNRPETSSDEDINVRREPSGPDLSPGAERGSLVPIPADNDGVIDPQ